MDQGAKHCFATNCCATMVTHDIVDTHLDVTSDWQEWLAFMDLVLLSADALESDGIPAYVETGLDNVSKCTDSSKSLALCTASKGRLWQLKVALPLNILHAWPHRKWVRIHLVIADDDDALNWVLTHCKLALEVGLLKLYSTMGNMPYWHCSVAKNTSHQQAAEDILVNLDGDNIIGPQFVEHVMEQFQKGYRIIQYEQGDGTCGRIACTHADFHAIRCYDEFQCSPMGAQDSDLKERLIMKLGKCFFKKVGERECATYAIKNSVADKVSQCNDNRKWTQMNHANMALFKQRRQQGQIIRNVCQTIGAQVVAYVE